MRLDPKIFKAYDIRGLYPEQITSEMSYHLGRSISKYLKPNQVVIGRDMREASDAMYEELIAGFIDSFVDAIDLGMVSTDVFYHACAELNIPGVMITASHNPPEYGGFKIVKKIPYILGQDDGLRDIYDIIVEEDYFQSFRKGNLSHSDFRESFVGKVLSLVDYESIRPMKVVADTGNGMAGPILQKTYACLPQIELIHINEEVNGKSPTHGWDPLDPENHSQLQKRVIDEGADLGFAFDGDGDRFFAIDDRGNFVSGDFLTALLAQHLLKKNPGSKIVFDVRSSWAVPNQIRKFGGIPIQEKVGHAFIKKRMAVEDAIFGGEVTGHYYFKDFHFVDSGILPSLVLLEMLSVLKCTMSKALEELDSTYFISGEINIPIENPSRVSKILQRLEVFFKGSGKIEKLDGLSIIFDDWHFNVRFSNTEPLLRLNLEANSSDLLNKKLDFVLGLIQGGLF